MQIQEKWALYVHTFWQAPSKEARNEVISRLVAAELSGTPSCVIHETHLWHQENTEYPPCPHCQGPSDPRIRFHYLCAARAERGRPTPRLDARPSCDCADCFGEKD